MKRFYHLFLIGILLLGQQSYAQAPGARTGPVPATSIASVTQNMKKYEGYFDFYYDEKSVHIFLEVDKLNKEFLYVNTTPAGTNRGNIAGFRIAKFISIGNKVMLTLPNYDYRAVSDNPYSKKAVEESFPQSIIWGFAPVAIEGEKFLIDITAFLLRDPQRLGDNIGRSGGGGAPGGAGAGAGGRGGAPAGGGAYRIDETRSSLFMENTKNFPKNTEFESMLTFAGSGGAERSFFSGGPGNPGVSPDPSAITVRTHHSFIELPDDGYKPREFDPRSGFNSMEYFDFATPTDQPVVKRYVRRWRLEKKDPNAAMSEAIKPIVFYVDRGAPDDIKKALIEGGSWWNQAFEAAGFKNAFQVKEMPEGADPMDIRYSVINWVHRPTRGFSNGAGIFDPRTGEIIKGEVTLTSMRDRQDFLIFQGLNSIYGDDKNAPKKALDAAMSRIKQLAAHELGHTIGFYHNHMGSAEDRSSVDDYPFPKITLKADGGVDISDAYPSGIGSYDKRAVMWGYSQFPKGADEKAGLEKIMQESIKQGKIFMFDMGVHPNSAQWDNGTDASTELIRLMQVRKKALSDFSEKAIPVGAPMATLEEVLVPVYLLHRYQIEAATYLVGGLDFRYAVRGDGQLVTKMLDPQLQWKAFDAVMSALSPDELSIPEKVIQSLPPYPIGYTRTRENFQGYTGSTFDPIGAAETVASSAIASLLDPEKAARLIEYHARDEKQPGLAPVIDKLIEQTWKAESVSGYKGELQRVVRNLVLKHLLSLAADVNAADNARSVALYEVDALKKWMTAQEGTVSGPQQKGDILFGLQMIDEFKANPAAFKPATPAPLPAGPPIGG